MSRQALVAGSGGRCSVPWPGAYVNVADGRLFPGWETVADHDAQAFTEWAPLRAFALPRLGDDKNGGRGGNSRGKTKRPVGKTAVATAPAILVVGDGVAVTVRALGGVIMAKRKEVGVSERVVIVVEVAPVGTVRVVVKTRRDCPGCTYREGIEPLALRILCIPPNSRWDAKNVETGLRWRDSLGSAFSWLCRHGWPLVVP